MNKGRAYSTDFKDHEKLLHKFTRGGFARLRSAGVDGFDYEDIYQEMCVSFVRATKTYNPEAGITFTAYMGRAVINNFNKQADRLIRENESVGHIKISDITPEYEDEEAGEMVDKFMMDMIDYRSNPQEEVALSKEAGRLNIAKLSQPARKVIRDLIKPSDELLEHHRAEYAQSQHAKEIDAPSRRIPQEIDLRYIVKYHGLRFSRFSQEIQEKLGISLS